MKKSLYYKTSTQNGPVDFADRWNDIKPLIDFNPNHIVLDVGCAEGLITIELAKHFKQVYAFDIERYRIKQAIKNANGIANINFETNNYMIYKYNTYDQVFCLGVYHKIKREWRRPMIRSRQEVLDTMFKKCKSTLYLRVPIISNNVLKTVGVSDVEVLKIADNNNFNLVYRSEPRYNHGTLFKFQKR